MSTAAPPNDTSTGNSTCKPMAQSTLCLDYAPAYVNFSTSWTVTTFDTVIKLWVDSPRHISDFNTAYGCLWDGNGLRFAYAFGCAQQVYGSTNACNTSQYTPQTWPRICKPTCDGYMNSLSDVFADPAVCPVQGRDQSVLDARTRTIQAIAQFCATYGSVRKTCVAVGSVEAASCGFSSVPSLVGYCQTHGNDDCCKRTGFGTNPDYAAVIALSVALGLVLLGILCYIGLQYYQGRRRHDVNIGEKPGGGGGGPYYAHGTSKWDQGGPGASGLHGTTSSYWTGPRSAQSEMQASGTLSPIFATSTRLAPLGTLNHHAQASHSDMEPYAGSTETSDSRKRERRRTAVLRSAPANAREQHRGARGANDANPFGQADLDPSGDPPIFLRPMSRTSSRSGAAGTPVRGADDGTILDAESRGLQPEAGSALAQPHRVVFSYHPSAEGSRPSDEISLCRGDVVTIREMWNDGWCVGLNQSSNEIGAYPLGCIAPLPALNQHQLNGDTSLPVDNISYDEPPSFGLVDGEAVLRRGDRSLFDERRSDVMSARSESLHHLHAASRRGARATAGAHPHRSQGGVSIKTDRAHSLYHYHTSHQRSKSRAAAEAALGAGQQRLQVPESSTASSTAAPAPAPAEKRFSSWLRSFALRTTREEVPGASTSSNNDTCDTPMTPWSGHASISPLVGRRHSLDSGAADAAPAVNPFSEDSRIEDDDCANAVALETAVNNGWGDSVARDSDGSFGDSERPDLRISVSGRHSGTTVYLNERLARADPPAVANPLDLRVATSDAAFERSPSLGSLSSTRSATGDLAVLTGAEMSPKVPFGVSVTRSDSQETLR